MVAELLPVCCPSLPPLPYLGPIGANRGGVIPGFTPPERGGNGEGNGEGNLFSGSKLPGIYRVWGGVRGQQAVCLGVLHGAISSTRTSRSSRQLTVGGSTRTSRVEQSKFDSNDRQRGRRNSSRFRLERPWVTAAYCSAVLSRFESNDRGRFGGAGVDNMIEGGRIL